MELMMLEKLTSSCRFRSYAGIRPKSKVDSGEKKTKIAIEFGVSRETLYQYLKTD